MDAPRAERTLNLKSPPSALWPQLSNTDRINRDQGRGALTSVPAPGGFARRVSMGILGWTLHWLEDPFEFVSERYYNAFCIFENGPASRLDYGVRLEPEGAGTRLTVHAAFSPRRAFVAPLLRIAAHRAVERTAELARKIDSSLFFPGGLPVMPRACSAVNEVLLASRLHALAATRVERAVVEKLAARLRDAYDDEVRDMRPFELADAWGLPRLAVLGACLHAVKAGLLGMSWDVLCPNCAGAGAVSSLREMRTTSHCSSCAIDFGVSLDESVELRFSAHPNVRAAAAPMYCAGNPAGSRHVVSQLSVFSGAPREVALELRPRSYAVRGLGSRRAVRLRPRADGPAALDIDLSRAEGELFFAPGRVTLRLRADAPEVARVETESWREAGATAALATSLQEFRDLFSSEVLSPGHEIEVKRLALLFTDLKGSTAMYERLGDAPAYGVVRDHFGYLTAIIAARNGAVVKTIGDAVMAVFASGADAVEAALDMQERIAELDAKLAPRPPVVLKIGVHEGAAIAINAGGVLDYFGTTANIAARVQNESEGGDVVVTDALLEDPAVAALLARRAPNTESFKSELKGLTGAHRLRRLRPPRR
jgi:class 3 adenylate cyclase